MVLFRADRNAARLATPVEGWCLTDESSARNYGLSGASIAEVVIDLDALTVAECDGYDPRENETPADSAAFRAAFAAQGVDVLVYADADETGREHTTYRLISYRALAAARVEAVTTID